MKPTQDTTYIISHSQERAEALRQTIDLRGVDEILTMPFEAASAQLKKQHPILVILDTEDGDMTSALQILSELTPDVKRIVLADNFNEENFLNCADHGVRDFLIKPVPNAYLVSSIIRLLQERRQQQLMSQKDRILEGLDVLSAQTGIFTTSYLLKTLESEFHQWQSQKNDSLCLLVMQITGLEHESISKEVRKATLTHLAHIVRECARDSDLVGELLVSKFAVILPHTAVRGARSLAKRLIERVHQANLKGPSGPLDIHIQTGIADAVDCPHYEALLDRAIEDLQQQTGSTANNLHMV